MKKIIQGSREVFDVDLGLKDLCSGSNIVRPADLTGMLDATSKICWQAGTTKIEKLFTDIDLVLIGVPKDGMVQGILDVTETGSFPADEVGIIEIVIDKGSGDVTKWQIIDAFQVVKKICD